MTHRCPSECKQAPGYERLRDPGGAFPSSRAAARSRLSPPLPSSPVSLHICVSHLSNPTTAVHAAEGKRLSSPIYLFTVTMMWKEQTRNMKPRNRAVKSMGSRQVENRPYSRKQNGLALGLLPGAPLQGRRAGALLLPYTPCPTACFPSLSQLSKLF